jgi:hypothetical protein
MLILRNIPFGRSVPNNFSEKINEDKIFLWRRKKIIGDFFNIKN